MERWKSYRVKPTIVKENFFEKPDEIVGLTDKIEWLPPGPKADWPGVRSKNLCDILPNLNNHIISEVLKLYYGRDNIEVLDTIIQFHKIKLSDYKNHNKKHTRFHKDYTDIAGLIYLSKNINDENIGTSILDNDGNLGVKISNVYNTLVCYDGNKLHGATGLNDIERLTIVIFLRHVNEKN
jgi:hypothetical protein